MVFKQVKTFVATNDNADNFAIIYDRAAGRRNRYTVLVWDCCKTCTVIGRELPLGHAKRIVSEYK